MIDKLITDKNYLTVFEAAAFLDLHIQTLYTQIRRGKLLVLQKGKGRSDYRKGVYFVPMVEVLRYLAEAQGKSRNPYDRIQKKELSECWQRLNEYRQNRARGYDLNRKDCLQ